ncbi:MAG: hypothetical protein HY520_04635 [Candidatus Aenigmarchaeota archaeon]|nr:hypothetical protein [Candidatus Aenigmarchaeota archaeon]
MMIFLIMVVVVGLIVLLTGYQITRAAADRSDRTQDRALFLLKQVTTHPLFVSEEGVLDDAKLTALATLPDGCARLEDLFGPDWFLEVETLDGPGAACAQTNYPACGRWELCKQDARAVAYDLPVNVYRNAGTILARDVLARRDLAILTVGVYGR